MPSVDLYQACYKEVVVYISFLSNLYVQLIQHCLVTSIMSSGSKKTVQPSFLATLIMYVAFSFLSSSATMKANDMLLVKIHRITQYIHEIDTNHPPPSSPCSSQQPYSAQHLGAQEKTPHLLLFCPRESIGQLKVMHITGQIHLVKMVKDEP